MRLLIAGGGTGGHIYPALAVARSLHARADAPDLVWVGGRRGLEAGIVPAADVRAEAGLAADGGSIDGGSVGAPARIRLRRLVLRSLRSTERDVHAILDPLRLAVSVPQAAAILLAERPAAIFTTGGYVAIPVLVAARALRIPVVLWEGNVIPGRSVRATAGLARVLAVSFAPTCDALASSRPCYVTGTPIRDTRRVDRLAARDRFGIPPGRRVILVFGGSQAVRRFNDAVAGALPSLVDRVSVIHVTGDAGYGAALVARDALPDGLRDRYRPFPFLREDMLAALAASDLVVGRAGSSTLAEVAALGIPSILVPYPHAAGHQRANAAVLEATGAARLVDDDAFGPEALLDAAAILDDPAVHARMAAAARSVGRPGAADAVGDLVLAVAAGGALPDPDAIDRRSRAIG